MVDTAPVAAGYDAAPVADNAKKMKLWHHFPFRSIRCMWLVHELGVEDDVEVVPFFPRFGERGASEAEMATFKGDVHYHGTVPALQLEDGLMLRESGAICLYLAERYGRLAPAIGTPERPQYLSWISYATSTADEYLEPLYWEVVHKKEEDRNAAVVAKSVEKFREFAVYFEDFIADREFVCGADFTAADCVMGYCVWWANHCGKGIGLCDDFPRLREYCERLIKRDGFTRCLPGKGAGKGNPAPPPAASK